LVHLQRPQNKVKFPIVFNLPKTWRKGLKTAREVYMSIVRTEITLKNAIDVGNVKRGYITEEQVRTLTVNALADTGAWTLVINEEICQKLGLELLGPEPGVLADGSTIVYQITDGVEVHWKNRRTICPALVVPGANEILFGALPMEGMDLMVHPRKEEVVGAHGDTALYTLK
jgi:clan AA aspartic protease